MALSYATFGTHVFKAPLAGKFCDFALKQTFRGINYASCVLILRVCALILMIL